MMKSNTFLRACFVAFVLTILISLCSCVSEKKRLKICQTCPITITKSDSIIIVTRDRKVPVFISDTVVVSTPNPCAELCDSLGRLRPFNRVIPGIRPNTMARLFTRNDSLLFEAYADSVKAMATVRDSLIRHKSEVIKEVPARCQLEHLSWWDKFFIACGKIFCCSVAITGIWMFVWLKFKK